MITDKGKLHIKRYMAGFVPSIAQSIAFGIGNKSTALSDTRLQLETGRTPIVLTSLDLVNNKLIYKGTIPETIAGTIYEVGIYSTPVDVNSNGFSSRILTSFDSSTETWLREGAPSTFASSNARIGGDSLRHSVATGGVATDGLDQVNLDLGGYSGADKFVFAYHVGNEHVAAIRFRLMTDGSNFFDVNLGAQAAGYQVTEVAKSSATATGTPRWDDINGIQVTTVAKSSGAAQVDFDAIRIEDVDTINPDYVLVARELLATPFVKQAGKVQEVEFAVGINV